MPRNVVLIILDSVRKDQFNQHAQRIQELADVSFSECRAPSCWSVPSHASFLTGKLPSDHGIHTHNLSFASLSQSNTLCGSLSDHTTLSVSANVYASSTFGFDQLFDKHYDIAPHQRFSNGMDMEKFIETRKQDGWRRFTEFLNSALQHNYPLQSLGNGLWFKLNDILDRAPIPKLVDDGAKLIRNRAKKLVAETEGPFFLFTNFMDGHTPYRHAWGYNTNLHNAPHTWSSADFNNWDFMNGELTPEREEHLQHHRSLYDAAIDYLDRQVATFVQQVQTSTQNETTFIVTADHGENMMWDGDNGLLDHSSSLTEGVLHVPFVIINPPADIEDPGLATLLDLPQMISAWANEESMVPQREYVPAEVIGQGVGDRGGKYWDRMIRCVYREDTKIEWDSLGGTVKYRLPSDPSLHQRIDEGVTVPDWARSLFNEEITEYKQRAQANDHDINFDESVAGRLKELGYL